MKRNDRHSIQNCVTKFQDFNLQNKLDMSGNADPKENLCKNPWSTQGLLNSINAKDKRYKLLLQTPTYSPDYQQLKTNAKTYKNIIRRTIMHAKKIIIVKLLINVQISFGKFGKLLMVLQTEKEEVKIFHKSLYLIMVKLSLIINK